MAKPIVVLIHGMGNHTAPKPTRNERGSFGTECISTLNTAFQMYPSLEGKNIEESVNFVEIHYNHLFDKFRADMAQNGQKIQDLLQGAGATSALGGVPGIVKAVINFESSLAEDDVIYTHWLDVIFYKLYYGELVRSHVAQKLGEIMTRNSAKDIHILAHSLGTAVIHDTLHKIYNKDYVEDDDIPDLAPGTHKLASLWQIANVSRLANSVLKIADPYKTLVKPGSGSNGVTSTMMNIHHKLDPFTLLKKFSRSDNRKWIPSSVYQNFYRDIETTDITQINTHSITQYLHDPAVHLWLFQRLGIKVPPQRQREKASKAYGDMVLNQAKDKLKAKFANVTFSEASTFKDYFAAAKRLKDVIEAWRD